MSNRETEPAELECAGTDPVQAERAASGTAHGVSADSIGAGTPVAASAVLDVLEPRDVPLGGPRAMSVRRTLPQRKRSLIGAWCFVDHYGPDDVAATGGMVVPPHPHTGLQTVSWLFAGEVDHRDSVGSHALVRPGELNLMTAGRGIQHSEVSTPRTTVLHGAQLWIALPDATRNAEPFFEHYVPTPTRFGEATVRVFLGSLIGQSSTATTFSPLVGAQIDLPAGASVGLPIDPSFEHGVLVDAGELRVESETVAVAHLGYLARGSSTLRLTAGATPVRALLIGGAPLGERILMWWNFIGRSHDEIVRFRTEWQDQVIENGESDGRFGAVPDYDGQPLPAPEMPTVRLKPRD
jgi:redox-sensitive bicupin YhaK (pirin superfamily)